MKDFLISYTDSDRPWAEWIAWVLKEHGYTVTIELWKSKAIKDAIQNLRNAIVHGRSIENISFNKRIITILSDRYLRSPTLTELGVLTLKLALESQNRYLLLVRVEDVTLTDPWNQLPYIDLADTSEVEAEQAILSALEASETNRTTTVETMFQQQAIAISASVSAGLEERLEFSDSKGNQLKARRRSHEVQFFVEPLTQNIKIEMMLVPAGVFLMGSPEDELERQAREGPQHEVRVGSLFMGKYPVTQAQWRFVAALPEMSRELKLEPSHFKGDNRPVESVSWYDAGEFCARLSAYTGRDYRLPTEAEWEYACRAGTTTPFHFGETITTDLANYNGSSTYKNGPKGEYSGATTLVDKFGTANVFGLCDMHGNVLEWCTDHWHKNYEGAPIDGSAWLSENNSSRVIRGGAWGYDARHCRSAYRSSHPPDKSSAIFGFRVVCSAP
ncbi:SUMF1/EgtB/PvdO family nonheme iron enzyme [Trichocoleus sp. FACHB-262]|uniref:SUMF1/EgtB/PvdO family nonheme iron enzyme n=1 Tax=Trichocoleus sp. FACHB-262 TaxID=2692869 RepID=UPI001682E5B3|nr:SUMF1/EgtB/PvdO family nonheme iron enzyme [Trichocoleus sp. FACHB-262]MBD2122356.1 SUMF1/EgtB/PvdO family nonheme iron enzyme [Trichocoleus sp. FACHB-262]